MANDCGGAGVGPGLLLGDLDARAEIPHTAKPASAIPPSTFAPSIELSESIFATAVATGRLGGAIGLGVSFWIV